MRSNLVSIQQVKELKPIENADKIEICILKGLGWNIIVRKDEVKVFYKQSI